MTPSLVNKQTNCMCVLHRTEHSSYIFGKCKKKKKKAGYHGYYLLNIWKTIGHKILHVD